MDGKTIGQYRIVGELGRGGMGVVYRAVDSKLERDVALKFLSAFYSDDPMSMKRFIREARAASALDHPNICGVYELGETDDGSLFIAMPLYSGETLEERIARGPLSQAEALRYARQIAEGLGKAHESGVVHRDLKPANIFITTDGGLKILDFGLAAAATASRVTRDRSTLGTAAYMSPEQARGEVVDGRTDLWSLGVVLFEMITGRRPFPSEYEQAAIYAILNEDPSGLEDLDEHAPALAPVVRALLQKDRNDRHADASELLRAMATAEPIAAHARKSQATRVALAILVVAAVAVGLWFAATDRGSATNKGRASAESATPPAVNDRSVVVFPFSVRGSAESAYLGEGMVDLFSTKIDGAGDWRAVDPRAVLGLLQQEGLLNKKGATTLAPQSAGGVARRLGAARFVLGNIVEVGGTIQLNASLYDVAGRGGPVTRGDAEGRAGDLMMLIDEVAAEIIVTPQGGAGERLTQLAAVTTSSLPALKAYLEGESAGRRGQFPEAVAAYRRAVDADTTFALAYFRLSLSAEWNLEEELARGAAEKAFEYSGRLSQRDQRLLEAFLVRRRGDNAGAERLYRSLLATHPDAIEVWIDLAEVLIHANSLRGRSFADSREAFEKILTFDEEHATSLIHLARIAAFEGKGAELDSLVARFVALDPGADRELELQALQAFYHRDPSEEDAVIRALVDATELAQALAVWDAGVYARNLDGAARLSTIMTRPDRSDEGRALGHAFLAHLYLTRGRWADAQVELDRLESVNHAIALETRALLTLLPFLYTSDGVAEQAIRAVRGALRDFDPAAAQQIQNSSVVFTANNGLHSILRAYLIGLASARLGDFADAERRASELTGLTPPASARTLEEDLSLSIRSAVESKRGNRAEALALLQRTRIETWYGQSMASPYFSQARERFARAELLFEAKRFDDALVWYEHIAETSIFELVYLPMASFRAAQIFETQGDTARARDRYERFIELWQDADPVLQSAVDQARVAVARLTQ